MNRVKNERKEQRSRYEQTILFAVDPSQRVSEGLMVDVASGGLAFRCDAADHCPRIGQKIVTQFSIPSSEGDDSSSMISFTRTGHVLRVETINPFLRHIVVQFDEPFSIKPSEEAKSESESHTSSIEELKLIEDIVERSPAIIFRWIIQEGWPVEYVSKNVEQLGYTQEDMLSGKVSWPGITHPNDLGRLEQEVKDFLTRGVDEWSQSYRIRAQDGEYRWMRDWNLVLRDEHGLPKKIQGIIIDITKEKTEAQHRERIQKQLEKALANVVSGFVSICAQCKAIRDEAGNWIPIESYITQKNLVQFSHGYCPECGHKALEDLKSS